MEEATRGRLLEGAVKDALSAATPELMLHRVWQRLAEEFHDAPLQSSALIEAGHGAYRVLMSRGISNQFTKRLIADSNHPVVEEVLRTGLPVDCRFGHPRFGDAAWRFEHEYTQLAAVPLIVGKRAAGAAFFDTRGGAPFGEEEVDLLGDIIGVCGLRLDRDRFKDRYERAQDFDPVTLTHSYKYFREALAREIRRADFERHTVALALLSIDHLREYNEVFGHQRAELALEKIAAIIGNGMRSIDEVARYGGAKYAVVMPVIPLEEAAALVEGVRATVAKLFHQDTGPSLTLSAGLAAYPSPAAHSEEGLIGQVEGLLLDAKRAQGNRVQVG